MSLKQLMDEIKDAQATASIRIEDIAPQVRPGVEGQVRSAVQRLPELTLQYKRAVLETSVPILVTGKQSEEFGNIAKSDFKTLAVNYNAANERVINGVKSRSQRVEFSNQEYLLVLNELNIIANEIGARSFSKPDNSQNLLGKDLSTAINSLLNGYYGDELRSAYAAKLAADLALESQFSGLKLPVVIYNSTGKISAPFGKPVATLEVDELPSKEEISEIFSKIKNKLKSKK